MNTDTTTASPAPANWDGEFQDEWDCPPISGTVTLWSALRYLTITLYTYHFTRHRHDRDVRLWAMSTARCHLSDWWRYNIAERTSCCRRWRILGRTVFGRPGTPCCEHPLPF